MNYLSRAIQYLRPGAQFSYTEDDYSTIQWYALEGDAPTQKEVNDAIKVVKANDEAEAEAKAQAKATAEGKLAALGLTTDDLRALGL
jgi:hypothetical protein